MRHLAILFMIGLSTSCSDAAPTIPGVIDTERGPVDVTVVAEGLKTPWGLAFLPDGRYLVTERGGDLHIVARDGTISAPIAGVPVVHAQGQGGLLDVVLDPQFADNRTIFLSYAGKGRNGAQTTVMRAVLGDGELTDRQVIFRQEPALDNGFHFGSRLVFDRDGLLYVTLGERNSLRDLAQDTSNTIGKVVRITRDGEIPAGNPFRGKGRADAAVYSYGHRNPQGAALDPVTGALWVHEHGPMGGDEINVIAPGNNYGWPVVTYGREYSGGKIGVGSEKAGMTAPLYYWVPSIAPSGMAFLTAPEAGPWRGNLFVGSLKFGMLVRLELEDGRVTHEERLLEGMGDRVRDVRAGPDGALYLLTESQGRILRLMPKGH